MWALFDVFIISLQSDRLFKRNFYIAHISSLKPKEKTTVTLESISTEPDFTKSLRKLGFTEKEIKSFESLWKKPFIEHGKLIYRLPKSECNKIITLAFDPKPKKIIRALLHPN